MSTLTVDKDGLVTIHRLDRVRAVCVCVQLAACMCCKLRADPTDGAPRAALLKAWMPSGELQGAQDPEDRCKFFETTTVLFVTAVRFIL